VADCYEHDKEASGFIDDDEFLHGLSGCWILKYGCAWSSWFVYRMRAFRFSSGSLDFRKFYTALIVGILTRLNLLRSAVSLWLLYYTHFENVFVLFCIYWYVQAVH
jgi:hypothetical protein